MSAAVQLLCDQVHAFADGELTAAEAERFRDHLAECRRCQGELEDVLQLQSLSAALRNAPLQLTPALPLRRVARRSRRTLYAASGALAAAAVVVLSVRLSGGEADPFALGDTRPIEARLSYPGASAYRAYDVKRAGGRQGRQVPLAGLARLEEKGDLHGVATGYLLRGEREQAGQLLAKAGESLEVQSDRAVVALSSGLADEALLLLDGVLRARPGHPQATWNRGLALRELGLPLAAAEALEEVARLREPGWAEEAHRRAEALSAEARQSDSAWVAANNLGRALVVRGELPDLESVRRFPGIWRLYFYDAVRAAPSRDRALALGPVAAALDELYGGSVLRALLERVAAADFAVRGPLAEGYARLFAGELDGQSTARLLTSLKSVGQPDLRLGALFLTHIISANREDYARLAQESGDPWFAATADQQAAEALEREQPLEAERLLLHALRIEEQNRLGYRAAQSELTLSLAYGTLHRVAEAWTHALSAFQRARRGEEKFLQRQALSQLASVARLRHSWALSRAFVRELQLREPGECATQAWAHRELAQLALLELEPAEARRELQAVPQCGAPPDLHAAMVRADLLRQDPQPGDLARVRDDLKALRQSGQLTSGEAALADQTEGRALIDKGRAAGRALLERAIAAADQLPRGDAEARKARGYSYAALVLDSGKAGDFGAALELLAREAGVAAPSRCAVGVAVDDQRSLLIVRGAAGEALGSYDGARKEPMERYQPRVEGSFLDALRSCPLVDVLARAPVQGRPGLLPDELAWRFRVGAAQAASGGHPPKRLVVADVEPPAALRLPHLAPWSPGDPAMGPAVELRGAAATPSRVLAAMRDATEIEIHAQGLADLSLSDASLIVLSPEADGSYALTAGEVRSTRFEAAPFVTLAACRGAQGGTALHAPWSLPVAFLEAGASAVLAGQSDVPDSQARAFFDGVRARVHGGASPAAALRDERLKWRGKPGASFAGSVLLFQ